MIGVGLSEVATLLFVGVPGGLELAILLLVVAMLFGPSKLPQLARSVGKAEAEFQKSRREVGTDLEASTRSSTTTSGTATETDQDSHTVSDEAGTVVS